MICCKCFQIPPNILAICRLAKQPGPCKANMHRFYYDAASKQCKKFSFGGCGGNGNNFETKEQCDARCAGYAGTIYGPPLLGEQNKNIHNNSNTPNSTFFPL